MKRGWTKFWLCASAIAVTVSAGASPQKQPPRGKGANELTVAGIQPGKDKLAPLEKQLGERLHALEPDSSGGHTWEETCSGRRLTLEVDEHDVIQSVSVSATKTRENCKGPRDQKREQFWGSGQGLKLGDSSERVVEIYGPPNSSGPSVKNERELELMFYMFDWAGSDVPQVMEVSCDKESGNVVEIMLAFPSL